ncbi:diaminopimelate epimerase [Zhaonella formicivorans]|uniref:diaminopimelate epimerase n=1 Tax=Zhaonella formicivorans TaxID=2528593 RepID=UPI0010E744A6|nr:diaminopimelate epimerase [Zhaonella formicivorans]
MKFTKMHGLGNDFVVLEGKELSPGVDLGELAVKVCDRHFGIGADGLMIILPSEVADIRMRIFNSDGSEAEMCGNGIRCFAKYVYEQGIVKKEEIRVETLAGIIVPRLQIESGSITGICVDMGEPHLDRALIPMLGEPGLVVNETLVVGGQPYQVTAVSMGNPHCVIYTGNLDEIPLAALGRQIETHYVFPKKTNVEFVQILSPNEVRMKVWERGAGETLACGTGACAVAVAGVLNLLTERKVTVHLAGGDLQIFWNEHDNHVYMTGPAETVFNGDYSV